MAGFGSCLEPVPLEGALCNADQPCGSGYACTAGLCTELQGAPGRPCASQADCGERVCDLDSGVCVQCTEREHCPGGNCNVAGNYCVDCLGRGDCDTGYCDCGTHICKACKTHAHCGPGGHCVDGTCLHGNPDEACPQPEGKGQTTP